MSTQSPNRTNGFVEKISVFQKKKKIVCLVDAILNSIPPILATTIIHQNLSHTLEL